MVVVNFHNDAQSVTQGIQRRLAQTVRLLETTNVKARVAEYVVQRQQSPQHCVSQRGTSLLRD